MREIKKENRELTFEKRYRRIKRLNRRENTIIRAKKRKTERIKTAEKETANITSAKTILSCDRKKLKPDRKPPYSKLLRTLSFIPYNISPYEKRTEIPADYKPRSFNEKRQYIDFVRRFIYPYKIPDVDCQENGFAI